MLLTGLHLTHRPRYNIKLLGTQKFPFFFNISLSSFSLGLLVVSLSSFLLLVLGFTGVDSPLFSSQQSVLQQLQLLGSSLFIFFFPLFVLCPKLLLLSVMPAPPPTSISSSPLSLLCFLTLLLVFHHTPSKCAAAAAAKRAPARRPRLLSVDYYNKTCPHLEQLVSSITNQQFRDAPVSAPATLRLFFHDCFVEVREKLENPITPTRKNAPFFYCMHCAINFNYLFF